MVGICHKEVERFTGPDVRDTDRIPVERLSIWVLERVEA